MREQREPALVSEQRVLDFIRRTDLADLAPVLAELSNKIGEHRLAHQGRVPRVVFPHVLGIAGQYTCIEYIPQVVNDRSEVVGYLLKQRGSDEQGWEGLYHIPGRTFVITPDDDAMKLVQAELAMEFDLSSINIDGDADLEPAGFEVHDEQLERETSCATLVMTLRLPEEVIKEASQGQQWKFFNLDALQDSSIVDHHRNTLAWHSRPGRSGFEMVDLRNKN